MIKFEMSAVQVRLNCEIHFQRDERSDRRDSVRSHAKLVLPGKVQTHATRCYKLCACVCIQLTTNIMFCFETMYLCLLDVPPSSVTSSNEELSDGSSESSAENINNDNSAIHTNTVHNSHRTS